MITSKETLEVLKELNYKQVYEKGREDEKVRWEKLLKELKEQWREKCKRLDILGGQLAIFELECLLDRITNHTQQDKTHSKKLSVEKSEKAGDVASFEKQDISCKGEHPSSEMTAHLPTSVRDKPAEIQTLITCDSCQKKKEPYYPNCNICAECAERMDENLEGLE